MVRAMSLRLQLVLLQAAIVCVVTLVIGGLALGILERQLREQTRDRMVGVALSIARLPAILDAFDSSDPAAQIQPIAEVIRESSDLTYVVVTDAQGIRYSHPNPERVGELVSTDPSIPLSGEIYVGTQTGTMGESWRVKVPIYAGGDEQGAIIGSASVGILESELAADMQSWIPWLLLAGAVAAVVGVFGAAAVTGYVRRRIFRLEPEEIAELVNERETLLHRLSEGVVTVDAAGRITLANDAAARLLDDGDLNGRLASEALESQVYHVLADGEPDGRLVLAGERPLIARGTGIRDDDGSVVGGTLLLRDQTELHAALRDMEGAQSLSDGLRAQAHEFTNSLHVVAGLLELDRTDEAREFIARIRPGGAMPLVDAVAGLSGEVSALLAVKAAQAREQGIGFTVAVDSGEVPDEVMTDLTTILGNLVDNALDSCSAGDRISVRVSGGQVVTATVDDSGPGVPDHLRETIFHAGVSTKHDGARNRGIGLALVRRIARRNGGTVSVTDSPEGGARFEALLPRRIGTA